MTTPANDPADTPGTTTASADPTDTTDIRNSDPANSDHADDDTTDGDQGSPNSEAAKRRRQLRDAQAELADTQTELSTVRDQLTGYQRSHAERAVADTLAVPADLFDVGNIDLTEYIDTDTGQVRVDELIAAATTLVEQRPQLGKNYTPPLPPGTDFGQGVRRQSAPSDTSWSSVLADQRRRQGHSG